MAPISHSSGNTTAVKIPPTIAPLAVFPVRTSSFRPKTSTTRQDLDRPAWAKIVTMSGSLTGQEGITGILIEVTIEEDLDFKNLLWATT